MDANEPPRVLAVKEIEAAADVPEGRVGNDPPTTPPTDDDDPSDFEIVQMERSKSVDTSLKQSDCEIVPADTSSLMSPLLPPQEIPSNTLIEVKIDESDLGNLITLDENTSQTQVNREGVQRPDAPNMHSTSDAIAQLDQSEKSSVPLVEIVEEPIDYARLYASQPKLRNMQVTRQDDLNRIREVLALIGPAHLPSPKRNFDKLLPTEHLIFNAEALLIIKLLTLSSSQRDIYLLQLADAQELLVNSEVRPEISEIIAQIKAHRDASDMSTNSGIERLMQNHELNEATIIIVDLLLMECGERESHLLKLAEKRKILFRYCDTLRVVNPRLKKLKFCLLLDAFIAKIDQFITVVKPKMTIDNSVNLVIARNENVPERPQPLLKKLNLQPNDDITKVLEGIDLISLSGGMQSSTAAQRPSESIRLNGENLMILDLLGMDSDEQREDYILRVALQRKLLIINKDTLEPELNQSLLKLSAIGVIDIKPCIESFKALPLPEGVPVLSEPRQQNDKDKYVQQGAIPKHQAQPPVAAAKIVKHAKSEIPSVAEAPPPEISKKMRGKNPLIDSSKPGSFRPLSANEIDSNVGVAKPPAVGKSSKKASKSVANQQQATYKSLQPEAVGSLPSNPVDDLKLKMHQANETLMQNLMSKMQLSASEQSPTLAAPKMEPVAVAPQPTEDAGKKQRKRKDRGSKASDRARSTDGSQASSMNSTENLPAVASSAFDNSIFQMFDQFNRQIDKLHVPDEQPDHAHLVKLICARMHDLANKLSNKRHVLKDKAKLLKKVQKKQKEKEAAPTYRDEVNRLHHEVTGQYSDALPKFLQINNVNEFIIFNNLNAVEKFVAKMVQHGVGTVVEGEIRVNAFNCQHAYISCGPAARDAMIRSVLLRQCAMHGDIVRVFVYGKTNVSLQSNKTQFQANVYGFVMRILEEKHDRQVLAHCSLNDNKNYVYALPTNKRVSRIKIFKNTVDGIKLNDQMVYLIKITEWQGDQPIGTVIREIGDRNVLSTGNEAILIENKLEVPTFSDAILNSLPSDTFVIPPEEYAKREVLTGDCVFTIDPATARDLDDAMSCKKLANGNYEIGVHISDVTYFLKEHSELDELVKEQATSIYLVDRVYHMLPRSLCMTCSLLPGEDKLTFSVFWEFTKDCRVVSSRFARTIIRSCAQLSYVHAQQMIEQPDREFGPDELPAIGNGCTAKQISDIVNILHRLALVMRQARYDRLCIKIDQPKIYFHLDPDSGEPTSFEQYKQLEANSLIEEFMLFANQSVAALIYKHFPDISILRNHAPPKRQSLETLASKLEQFHYTINLSSVQTISESFYQIVNGATKTEAVTCVLNDWLAKPMNRAEYFCSDIAKRHHGFLWHFALSIPIYTHFTSPIRRYPDILVHRVLAAALKLAASPTRKPEELQKIATRCNVQKYNAKLAGEESTHLYFLHYVKARKVLAMQAVITELINVDHTEIMLMATGTKIKIFFGGDHKPKVKINIVNEKPTSGWIMFPDLPEAKPIKAEIFAEIMVEVYVVENKLRARVLPNKQAV